MKALFLYSMVALGIFAIFFYKSNFYNNHIEPNNVLKRNMLWIFSFLAFVFPYFMCFFGIDYTDTPYHLNVIKSFSYEDGIMQWGTILFCRPILRICNYNILYIRFFTTFLMQLSLFLPILALGFAQLKDNYKKFLIVFSATMLSGIIFAPFQNCNLSYDTMTKIGISVIMALLIWYYRTSEKRLLVTVLLCLATALFVSFRVPNVAIIPFVTLFFIILSIIKKDYRTNLINCSIYLALTVVFYIGIVSVLFGSFSHYIDLFSEKLTNLTANGSGHSYSSMLFSIYHHAFDISIYLTIVAIAAAAFKTGNKFIYSAFIVLVVFLLRKSYNPNCADLSYFSSALTLYLLLLVVFKKEYVGAYIIFGCFFVTVLGSDTGLLKTAQYTCLPFLSWIFIKGQEEKKIVLMGYLSLILFFIVSLSVCTFFSGPISDFKSKTDVTPRLSNILMSDQRVNSINNAVLKIQEEKSLGKNVICLGISRNLFLYLTDVDDVFKDCFYQKCNDNSFVDNVVNYQTNSTTDNYYILLKLPFENSKTKLEYIFDEKSIPYSSFCCE